MGAGRALRLGRAQPVGLRRALPARASPASRPMPTTDPDVTQPGAAQPDTAQPDAARLVAVVCAAQVLVQIGAFFWPALLPGMMQRWNLSNSEAGWITATFYAAYMVSVPVLVTLTDRVDPKRIYLFGVACSVLGHLLFGLLAARLVVGGRAARARRHGLGRHLHDRPEAAGRPGRRQDDVARRHRPRRQHRRLGRALLPVRRFPGRTVRLARRFHRRGAERRGGLAHRGAGRARAAAAGACGRGQAKGCTVRLPPGAEATARPWPTPWPTACTRSR